MRTLELEISCRICESFEGCRGPCTGTPDRRPCTAFQWAENCHGGLDPATGDLLETLTKMEADPWRDAVAPSTPTSATAPPGRFTESVSG